MYIETFYSQVVDHNFSKSSIVKLCTFINSGRKLSGFCAFILFNKKCGFKNNCVMFENMSFKFSAHERKVVIIAVCKMTEKKVIKNKIKED